MSLIDKIATIAAAKLVFGNMAFNEKSMFSVIIQAQRQLRQLITEATTRSKITDF